MAADTTSAGGSGRGSVRVSSTQQFQHGLFIIDILHIPTGCGTWPSFWLLGANWPNNGEIDIVEGVHLDVQNSVSSSIAVAPCNLLRLSFLLDDSSYEPGLHQRRFHTGLQRRLGAHRLWSKRSSVSPFGRLSFHVLTSTRLGCSIMDNSNITFGSGFNDNQGGVYATEWTSDAIKIWFFPRGAIPVDVSSANPDPTGWGTPTSLFTGTTTAPIDAHFEEMQIIFDLTFCGQWAGQQEVWGNSSCGTLAPTCSDYVLNTPSAFTEAYWAINTLQVFTEDGSSANATVPARLKRNRR
jgi:hypothetical protein